MDDGSGKRFRLLGAPLLKRSHSTKKVDFAELRPVYIGEIELTVNALPQQEPGQTDLAARADDEVEIREPLRPGRSISACMRAYSRADRMPLASPWRNS